MAGDLIGGVAWVGRDATVVAEAVKVADKWRDLPQSIRSLVLEIAVDARPDLFDRILKAVPAEPDRTRRDEMLGALSGVRDPVRQKAALGLILDPKVDVRESLGMIYGASSEANRVVSQQFFRDHQDATAARVPH